MIILLIIACVFIYFSFFHQESDADMIDNISNEYEWERAGSYAYLSQSIPNHVDKAVYTCHIKHQGQFVNSHLDLLNDENNYFCAVAFINELINEQKRVCLTIPVNALNLPRNIDIDIEIVIKKELNISGEVKTYFSTISKTIYISKDMALVMDWFLPILQIQTIIALRWNDTKQLENWKPEYIKIIKECYKDIIFNNKSETNYLKNSLKSLSNQDLSFGGIIAEYDRRSLFLYFSNPAFISVVDLIIEKIKSGQIINIVDTCEDIEKFGMLLKANHDIINSAINLLREMNDSYVNHNHHKYHNSNDKDKAWALGILGLSDNATQTDMKKAYRKKISEMHPDKYQELPESIKQVLEQTTQDINKAKEILGF